MSLRACGGTLDLCVALLPLVMGRPAERFGQRLSWGVSGLRVGPASHVSQCVGVRRQPPVTSFLSPFRFW